MAESTSLKLAIVASGRTQKDIADEIGMHQTQLSKIARGRRHASDVTRRAIADALGRHVDDIDWAAATDEQIAA